MMDDETLGAFLQRQRWYAGKGRGGSVAGRSTVAWLRRELPAVRLELVAVRYPDGEVETYQVPLVHHEHPVDSLVHAFVAEDTSDELGRTFVYDALHDKAVTGLWLRGIAEGATAPGGGVVFHEAPGSPELPVDAPSLVISAEQSNTSVVYDDSAIMKVFRKVAAGVNPDIEVHEALARAGSTSIAPPLGWVEGRWVDPVTSERVEGSLAMVQAFLHNATEGWELAKTSVRDLFAEGDLHADEVGGDFASEARRLGAVTADVHADLARTMFSDSFGREELARLADGMRRRLERAAHDVPELAPAPTCRLPTRSVR